VRATGFTSGTGRRGRRAIGWIRASFVAWLTVFALTLQLASAPAHSAMPDPPQAEAVAALGALKVLLGPHVALCLHEDGSAPGSPARDSHDCCADCALCQSAGHSAALVPPGHAVPLLFTSLARRLGVFEASDFVKPRSLAFAQPRAPPISPLT
jgi:hypothetical protein